MALSGVWSADQTFKCTDFNCGCELKMVTPPQKPLQGPLHAPACVCGSSMKRWPQAALQTDRYNDI